MFKNIFIFYFIFICYIYLLGKDITAFYYAELFSNFTMQYFLLNIAILLFNIFYTKSLLYSILSLFLLKLTFPFQNIIFQKTPDIQGNNFSIMQFNICKRNNNPIKFINYIRSLRTLPDIILVQEVTPNIAKKLTTLEEDYPFTFKTPELDSKGMMIFSRIPISRYRRLEIPNSSNKYSLIEFNFLNHNFTILEFHATSSAIFKDYKENHRLKEIKEITEILSKISSRYKMLVGDLNTTPYSPYYSYIVKNADVRSGIVKSQGSWPSFMPYILRIPIDHILITDKFNIINQELGPNLGSDHLPLLSYISILP